MHMKDDHMRNAQLKPGYNVQIGVDSEYMSAHNSKTIRDLIKVGKKSGKNQQTKRFFLDFAYIARESLNHLIG